MKRGYLSLAKRGMYHVTGSITGTHLPWRPWLCSTVVAGIIFASTWLAKIIPAKPFDQWKDEQIPYYVLMLFIRLEAE